MKTGEYKKRKTMSDVCKENLRQKNLGKKHSAETKLKMSLARKGKKMPPISEQTRIKMSESAKRKIVSEETRKKLSVYHTGRRLPHGRKLSSETKKKMSLSRTGHKNWRWISDRNQLVKSEKKHLDGKYRGWMLSVKIRDNWKCRIADVNCDGRLEAHHILNWKNYPELRYEVNNGITLCHAHHPRGRVNEAKLSPFFQELVAEGK